MVELLAQGTRVLGVPGTSTASTVPGTLEHTVCLSHIFFAFYVPVVLS